MENQIRIPILDELSRKIPHQPHDSRQCQAQQNARRHREIKAEIVLFDGNIARQFSQPRNRGRNQPHQPDQKDQAADYDQCPGGMVHHAQL